MKDQIPSPPFGRCLTRGVRGATQAKQFEERAAQYEEEARLAERLAEEFMRPELS